MFDIQRFISHTESFKVVVIALIEDSLELFASHYNFRVVLELFLTLSYSFHLSVIPSVSLLFANVTIIDAT